MKYEQQIFFILMDYVIIEQIIRLAKGIKIVTWVILILLIIISTAIISNTIKLTVHAR